jgi:hypothetical protein
VEEVYGNTELALEQARAAVRSNVTDVPFLDQFGTKASLE